MILSGEKKEEYREIKEYFMSRLLYRIQYPRGGYFSAEADILKGDWRCLGWNEFTTGAPIFEHFDIIKFTNGYSKTSPSFTIECKGIEIREGKPEWGATPGEMYFVLKLGEILTQ